MRAQPLKKVSKRVATRKTKSTTIKPLKKRIITKKVKRATPVNRNVRTIQKPLVISPNYQHNKWDQHNLLLSYESMKPFLPETMNMSLENLQYYINKYGECVAKQHMGQLGNGFYTITRLKAKTSAFLVKNLDSTVSFDSIEQVYEFFAQKKTPYMIQQKIDLVKVNDGITDVRVILQEVSPGIWNVTGKCVKIAPPNCVVTYTGRPDREVSTIDCLSRDYGKTPFTAEELNTRLNVVALAIINILKPYLKNPILGLDIGVDTKGRIWLIEAANTHPHLTMFTKLPDKTMLDNILKHKANAERRTR